jgi:hypothetical protein
MNTLKTITAIFALALIGFSANAQTWNLAGNAGITSTQFLGSIDAQPIRFKTAGVNHATLDATGRFGIGIVAPVYKFDVYTNALLRAVNINNQFSSTASTYGIYNNNNNAGTGNAYGSYNVARGAGGSNFGVVGYSYEGANNYGIYGQATSIAGGGAYGAYTSSTGVGNLNYGYYGSVTGTALSKYGLYAAVSGAGTTSYGVYGSASGATTNWAGYFVQNTYTGGSVGIGTTTIFDSKFSVQQTGTALATAKFLNTSKGANVSWIHFGATGDWYLRSAANTGKIILQDQNASATVCIGSTQAATGYKLSVAGKVICTELKVLLQTNWPDYVFAKDYKLMPLKKLEEFIGTNNHLPGVPSATQMEKDGGIAVGEMQTVLLKKLEEANLYILQLNKRLEELEAKVK